MANLRKAMAVVMGFMACVACLGLAGCGGSASSQASQNTTSASSAEVAQASHTSAERLEAPADAEQIATELISKESDVNLSNARVTAFANKTSDGQNICQVYLFSGDGNHDAYVAFDYDTKEVHGMDVDETNVIPYDTVLMSVL